MDTITDLKTALAEGKLTSEQYVEQLEAIARANYEVNPADRQRRERLDEAKTINWHRLTHEEEERRERQLLRDIRVETQRRVEPKRPRVLIDAATLNNEQFASLERAIRGIASAQDYRALEAAGATIEEA